MSFNPPPKREILIYACLILATVITYINILPNKLFFDDEELIYKNFYVQNLSYFPKYFTTNMIAGAGKTSNMYRPVLTLSFALDWRIWKNNPAGFHLTSLILHALNGILVFMLVRKIFRDKLLAFLTAIFFIVHPFQSEPVAYASGRTDPLYAFFLLLSVLLFSGFINDNFRKFRKYCLSVVFAVLSVLSKEVAVILPIILTLLIFVPAGRKKEDILKSGILLIPFYLISFVYVFLRLTVLNFVNSLNFYSGGLFNSSLKLYSQNLAVRFFTFGWVFFQYIALTFFPKNLIIARTPVIIESFLNIWVIMFLLTVTGLLFVSIKIRKNQPVFIFSFLWFFICLFPVSGVIPINNVIAEHYLYLPSVGMFLPFAYFFGKLLKKTGPVKIISTAIVSVLLLLMIIRTVKRTFDWRDPITFYTISLIQTPGHLPMWNNLAMAYQDNGQTDRAIAEYQKLIKAADFYPNTHHNLANAYRNEGRFKEAETEYLAALKMDPNFIFSYYGLLGLYKQTGETDKYNKIMETLKNYQTR